jgi:HpcH/HpaI aldolase/citrate lyase family
MIAKAAVSDADLVFLDLEDSVAPAAKQDARQNVVRGLNELDWHGKTRAYRINGVHTPWCHGDLIDVVSGAGARIDVVIVPKVRSARDVWFVDDLLTQLERRLGLPEGRIGLELLIEETEALARVEDIAACSPRVEALILGVGDLSASQGIRTGHIGGTPDARRRAGQRAGRDRRAVRELPRRGRVPAGGGLGRHPRRGRQVVHPPGPGAARQRGVRPDGGGGRARQPHRRRGPRGGAAGTGRREPRRRHDRRGDHADLRGRARARPAVRAGVTCRGHCTGCASST